MKLTVVGWAALAAGAIILALGIALQVQSSRLETAQKDRDVAVRSYTSFVAQTELLGDAAEKRKREVEAQDKKAKERADAENKDLRRELDVRRKQLRDARNRAGGGLVPQTGGGPASPGTITFDRGELDRALREYEAEVEGLIGEGAEAVIDINNARDWAKNRRTQ